MPRNIEVKFRDVDLGLLRQQSVAIGASDRGVIVQVDTFFRCANGRLKLRDFGSGTGELIAYERADDTGNRASDYQRSPTNDPASLLIALTRACGVSGRVAKRRNLWIWRNVRIHLDTIEALGEFAELESVIGDEANESTARVNLDEAIEGLRLGHATRLAGAYVDLLSPVPSPGTPGQG